ncbi:MAG TPA: hypothetical protein V6C69_04070 [Trichormus sp.]
MVRYRQAGSRSYGEPVEVLVVVLVAVPPAAGVVLVDVVVAAVDVDVSPAAGVVDVDVDVVDVLVSVLPPQAANEATIAKLAAARAMVFMFNVIKLNRLLLACIVG